MNETVAVTVDRAWTANNHLILDFIGHELHAMAYKDIEKQRRSWKNEVSRHQLMNMGSLLRYADRENIISQEIKDSIPKYKRYVYLKDLCDEWSKLAHENKLEKDKSELFEKHLQEGRKLYQELQFILDDFYEVQDLISGDAIHSAQIEFKIDNILDRYKTFFQKRRREYLKDLIRRTSKIRFTLDYQLRIPLTQYKEKNGEPYSIIVKVDLKKVKVENDNIFNVEINGNVIKVIFDTFFGNLYFHNILTLNTDWFEENFLELDGFASAIYRRFFVTRSGNKFDQLPIKDLVQYFDFLKNSNYPKVIASAFEDIKKAGLIHDYRFFVNGGKFSKGYIEVFK
jgi:hypothetical protein